MSDGGLRDDVSAELNPTGDPDDSPQPECISDRPGANAATETWVDYAVSLGASREFLTTDTKHFDGEGYVTEPPLSREDLVKLADRLGG